MAPPSQAVEPPANPARFITYFHWPKRARKHKAEAAAIAGPILDTAASRKRGPKQRPERETDPEVKTRVDAFFARMVRPPDD